MFNVAEKHTRILMKQKRVGRHREIKGVRKRDEKNSETKGSRDRKRERETERQRERERERHTRRERREGGVVYNN